MAMDRILERLAKGTPLRVGEVCRITGYSDKTIREWAETGRIETVGIGQERRYPVGAVRMLCEEIGIIEETL